MTHQLDTVEISKRVLRKKERVAMWNPFPKIVRKIGSRVGLLPPSDPAQISRIIEKSIAFETLNGLISLERQGCTAEYTDLSLQAQEAITKTLQSPKNGMERLLGEIVKNIPQ